jgi:hypothetical protein
MSEEFTAEQRRAIHLLVEEAMARDTPTPLSHVERGRLGAAKRWGERRVVRLDRLDPATAAVIRAILRAEDNARITS